MRGQLVLLTVVLGCGSAAQSPEPTSSVSADADAGALRVELGTGVTSFAPLADGDGIELVMGPQGGWHVDLTARLCGGAVDGVRLVYRVVDADDGTVLTVPTDARLTSRNVLPGDGCAARVGDRAVFDIDSAAHVVGRTVRVELTAETPQGSIPTHRTVGVVDNQP